MFYTEKPVMALRLGDIIQGYPLASTVVENPGNDAGKFNIDVITTELSVIITPCCSIKDKTVVLSPLLQVESKFFKNPFFEEDLTRINSKVAPEKTVPPQAWESMPAEKREEMLATGSAYVFLNHFIYAPHGLLPKYVVHRREGNLETNYYLIDLKNTHKVFCSKIVTPENSPVETKILQLSDTTRNKLREKMASFYSRIPQEELASNQ